MQYRRAFIPGASYFFTVVTRQRRPLFSDPNAVEVLRQSIRSVIRKHPFTIDAAVILPDHLHCIWTLPPDDVDFSTRWRLIKTAYGKRSEERGLWQNRFWEHVIRDKTDLNHHIDYIHYNPVKHGHVSTVSDWPYSSFHRFVRQGLLPEKWGSDVVVLPDSVGHE